MPNPPNRCPACGRVEPDLSSRYCGWHFEELQASCRDQPLEGCAGELADQSARPGAAAGTLHQEQRPAPPSPFDLP